MQRLADALVDELAEVDYGELTVRNVARRAGVAPATAYTYFTSKAHLVAEVFWRRLRTLPDTPDIAGGTATERVTVTLRAIADLVAAEPRLAAACSPALLGSDPDVRELRDRVGTEIHRRLVRALGDTTTGTTSTTDDDVVDALDLMVAGALLRAGMGHMSYDDLADRLATLVPLVTGGRR